MPRPRPRTTRTPAAGRCPDGAPESGVESLGSPPRRCRRVAERDAFERTGIAERCLLGAPCVTERLIAAWRHRVHAQLAPQFALLRAQSLGVDHGRYSIT